MAFFHSVLEEAQRMDDGSVVLEMFRLEDSNSLGKDLVTRRAGVLSAVDVVAEDPLPRYGFRLRNIRSRNLLGRCFFI
jgi:hypothetical protein